jgi:hypothetical protein
MKYAPFLTVLEDEQIYTPATIARNGERRGLIPAELDPQERRLRYTRVRIALGRFSSDHDFPAGGDGFLEIPGQPPQRGWFGWRWKRELGGR